ncbi:MAG: hypothetical protein FWC50_02285 [Planctomycetaceae bacterium]|nr:hypothetical protein [Planctomycetaceae bacterium]
MLVEIESIFGDRLISGKKCTLKELREKVRGVIKRVEMTGGDFTEVFCHLYQFEELPHDNIQTAEYVTILNQIAYATDLSQVDYVIDLDINKVSKVRH